MKSLNIAVAIALISIFSGSLQACRLTIINDTADTIVLSPIDEGQTPVTLAAGDTKFYGAEHQHAHFSIMKQDATGTMMCLRVIQQTACASQQAAAGFKISDLLADPVKAALAKIFAFSACERKRK